MFIVVTERSRADGMGANKTFSDDQIAVIEDRVMNLLQRPVSVLQEVFQNGTVDDQRLLNGLSDLQRLVDWVRTLREPANRLT